jgi:ribonuclease P protein component
MKTIKSKKEFEEVFSGGKRVNHRLVRATVLRYDEGGSEKVAFVAPKRLGNAVYRNRCKRILREAARACGMPIEGARIILFATRQTHESTPAEVSVAIESILSRAGIRGGQGLGPSPAKE